MTGKINMAGKSKKRGKKPSFLTYFGKEYPGIYIQKRGDKESYYTLDSDGKQIYLSIKPVKAIQKFQELKEQDALDNFIEVDEESQTIPKGKYGGIIGFDCSETNMFNS